MASLTLVIAFVGGVVSFLSPCVLPIVPGFLAYLAGSASGTVSRKETFLNSLFFVIGFSVVFAALGILLNTVLASVAYGVQAWLSRLGGLLVIFFGIYLMGLIKIPWLEREYRPAVKVRWHSRYATSVLFGAAFAAGWTPCVGAALGAILALAATQPAQAFGLLLAYSLGLGMPFLLVGLFAAQASVLVTKYGTWLKYINVTFGAVLVVLGILVFTQNLSLIANWSLLNSILLK